VLFWDTRSADEYSGAAARNNPPDRAGHLPGAIHLEWLELVDGESRLLKPADAMHAILGAQGITPERVLSSRIDREAGVRRTPFS
jgi:thiosulfate/3-mercaptopyruvate sulfurtransferase